MLLDLVGYQTFIASDGHQAVDLAGEVRPEVVLMDIGLPGLNGYDACRKIREQPWGTAMSVIAVTGWAVDHDQPRSEAAGFDHYLLKPVDFDELRSVLAELAQ